MVFVHNLTKLILSFALALYPQVAKRLTTILIISKLPLALFTKPPYCAAL
jgi:hypothetical protein